MGTQAGIGRSTRRSTSEAVRDVVALAAAGLGGSPAQFCLVHATSRHDQQAVVDGLRAAYPGVRIAGCSGEGIIAEGVSDESEFALALLAVRSDALTFHTFLFHGYDGDPAGSGAALAAAVNAADRGDGIGLFVFPDGLTGNCETFLAALEAGLARPLTIAGGAAGDGLMFRLTHQYGDETVATGALSAVLVSGRGRVETAVSHGCDAIGLERRVTRAEGGWVHEIDDRTSWSVFREYLDGDPQDLNTEGAIYLSVGVPFPEGASGGYEPYIVRTPMGLDPATGALFFPGGGFAGDGRIRLTRRDPVRVADGARACAERIARARPEQRPAFVLQFDCAGRGKQLFGSRVSESIVQPLRDALDPAAPWIGFHTYGEIAPIGAKAYYHNLTTALCAVYADP
jgi:hypothetical protein